MQSNLHMGQIAAQRAFREQVAPCHADSCLSKAEVSAGPSGLYHSLASGVAQKAFVSHVHVAMT